MVKQDSKQSSLWIFASNRMQMLLEMQELLIDTKKKKAPLPCEYEELSRTINKLISYEAKSLLNQNFSS